MIARWSSAGSKLPEELSQKIVNENIDHALIIEDDVQEDAIEKILHSNIIFNDYDIINLSKRLSWNKYSNNMFFDGAEAYVLSHSGAHILWTRVIG